MKVYQKISGLLQAIKNCEESNNNEWLIKHTDKCEKIINTCLPFGAGFDSQTFLEDNSTPEKLNIKSDYHCMNDGGFYDGWIELNFIVTPSLQYGFNLRVNWHGYNGKYKAILDDYIYETWQLFLDNEYQDD